MQRIEEVILFQIDWTSKVSKQYSQRDFDQMKLGITVEQWILLIIVSENPKLSQRDMADKSFRDPASITRTLDILEKKGLVSRVGLPNDRRAYNIDLTEQGTRFVKENMKTIHAHRQKSIEGISKDDLYTFSRILKKIRENMQ